MTQKERRIAAYMNLHGLSRKQAEAKVKQKEQERENFEHAAREMMKHDPTIRTYAQAKKQLRKSNPIKSTRISGRKGLSKTAYVNRPSQAPEHKAPTKRLKARRKKALSAPQGYFPNPSDGKIYRGISFMKLPKLKPGYAWLDVSEIGEKPAWKMIVSPHPEGGKKLFGYDEAEFMAKQYRKKNPLKPGIEKSGKGGYRVEYSGHENGPWKLAGAFPTVGAARDYAKALAAKNPKIWFRVAD